MKGLLICHLNKQCLDNLSETIEQDDVHINEILKKEFSNYDIIIIQNEVQREVLSHSYSHIIILVISPKNVLYLAPEYIPHLLQMCSNIREKLTIPIYIHFHNLFDIKQIGKIFAANSLQYTFIDESKLDPNVTELETAIEEFYARESREGTSEVSEPDELLTNTLVVYATTKGHAAIRLDEGSAFILKMADILKKSALFEDIFAILRNIQREFFTNGIPNCPDLTQIIEFISYGFDIPLWIKPFSKNKILLIEVNYLFEQSKSSDRSKAYNDGNYIAAFFCQRKLKDIKLNEVPINELPKTMKSIIEEYGSQFDMLILLLMSHGYQSNGRSFLYDSNKQIISIDEIIDVLKDSNSPALKEKPKFVFIQACRGGATTRINEIISKTIDVRNKENCAIDKAICEFDSDSRNDLAKTITHLYVVYSTLHNNGLLKLETGESLFTHHLCDELTQNYEFSTERDFTDIIRSVSYKMRTSDCKKQCAEIRCIGVDSKFIIRNNGTKRGLCYIFDNLQMQNSSDCKLLTTTFSKLNYKVVEKHELSGREMKNEIRKLSSSAELEEYNFLILIICGISMKIERNNRLREVVLGYDNKAVFVEDIIEYYSNEDCVPLKNKFKAIIIIGPRGSSLITNYNDLKLISRYKVIYNPMREIKQNLDPNTVVGIYEEPFYITSQNQITDLCDIPLLFNLQYLRAKQPTKLFSSNGSEKHIQKLSNDGQGMEIFRFELNSFFDYQTHIRYNIMELYHKSRKTHFIKFYINFHMETIDKIYSPQLDENSILFECSFGNLNYEDIKEQIFEIFYACPDNIIEIFIVIFAHGNYDKERKENYIIANDAQKIYVKDFFDLFPKNKIPMLEIQKRLYVCLCDYCSLKLQTKRDISVIPYVFDTKFENELFVRNADIFLNYIREDVRGDYSFEQNQFRNRLCEVNQNGYIYHYNASKQKTTFAPVKIDLQGIELISVNPVKADSIESVYDEIRLIANSWNTENIFIFQISIMGKYTDDKFTTYVQREQFDLKNFLHEIIAQNPKLKYAPKIFIVNVYLQDQLYSNIPLGETKFEKLNSFFGNDTYNDVTVVSNMIIFWSTLRGYGSTVSIRRGSILSFIFKHLLARSRSVKLDFVALLQWIRMAHYKEPIEVDCINMKEKLMFGMHFEPGYFTLEKEQNGYCVIMINQNFPKYLGQRYLTDIIAANYFDEFRRHNFECKTYNELTAAQMCQCLVEIAVDEKLEQHEALIVIIISKSESINNVDVIYGTDGGYFTLNNLKMLFSDESCKALKNKLKMFIIDGPRGDKIFDFRNEKEEKACENLKSLFDTSKLIKGNEDEPSNIHMITPYGSLLAGKNFHLSSGENHEYYVERIVENGMKKYNIQQFQDGLHDFICPIIFNDLAQYAGNLSFWEKTNNDSTNSFPGETLLHQFRQSKCRYPVLQNCDGASCFCGI